MPQFDATTFPSQLFWLLICFVTLLLFSARVTLPRLNKVFSLRWGKIEGTLKEAEDLNQQAEHLVASYELNLNQAKKKAHEMVLGTARQSSADLSRKKAQLAKDHKKRFRDTELVIANKKAAAMGDVQVIARTLAADLLQALAQEGFEPGSLETAVSSGMAKRVSNEY